jgi:tRNA-splicing ligase RtcB (3'-phosphate/5'-hydroxy nucleic acid ligase)
MGKYVLKSKDLSKIGYTDDATRSIAITIFSRHFKFITKEDALNLLIQLKENPESFEEHESLAPLAKKFIKRPQVRGFSVHELNTEIKPFHIFGGKEIEGTAKRQMELAMQLPVSAGGAMMPDAHTGYGLPVGGVLATEQAVIPYAVGVDIGCRMALSVYDLSEKYFQMNSYQLKKAISDFTHFGMDGGLSVKTEHEILDSEDFNSTPLLRTLHGKAVKQLGTSGGGNHFVEFGILELNEINFLNMNPGRYLALLSHSGSRGLGAAVAKHYTQIAMDTCKLPKQAQHLAWLDMNTEAGQEYWLSMNLAGEYSRACHDVIHYNISKAIGEKPVAKVENHHNFAWEEIFSDGRKLIVHRKGATPAHLGEPGIIPGSMTTPGYLITGKGIAESLNSASHGAGRRMSRGKAKESFTMSAMKKILSAAGVTLIGGTTEECPDAYKDIETVMKFQTELVDIHGKFFPKIVRMNKE